MRPAATAAAVGHAWYRSRVRGPGEVGTRGASGQAALGACGRDERKERERKREERFAAMVATGGEEKEKESSR